MRIHEILPVLPFLMAGCDAPRPRPAEDAGAVVVAVTLHPVASVVESVGGDAVSVRTLLPPGAHPDSYEATPRVAEAMAGAALVVRIGGPADQWLGDPGEARELVLTRGMRLRDAADGHDHGATGNPHVWLDPVLVRDSLLPRLVDALADAAPDSAGAIRARGAAYRDSLTALDAEIRGLLRDLRSRRFVAAHPAWVYFADRYGLEEIGALHPSPGRELGSRDLARLVEEARSAGVGAVMAEPQLGRAGTAALADELGVRVEIADPVGGPALDGREDYLSLMRYNARAFARALGGGT